MLVPPSHQTRHVCLICSHPTHNCFHPAPKPFTQSFTTPIPFFYIVLLQNQYNRQLCRRDAIPGRHIPDRQESSGSRVCVYVIVCDAPSARGRVVRRVSSSTFKVLPQLKRSVSRPVDIGNPSPPSEQPGLSSTTKQCLPTNALTLTHRNLEYRVPLRWQLRWCIRLVNSLSERNRR